NGNVTELKVLIPSGTAGFDNAAVGALRAADLMPLPSDYPDDRFDIIIVFWYNERPYDLF
ncbi:TonB family protein, partial [Desulfosarcina sp.]|nr:TonB family protein [Desulfosarcina sp.]